MDDNLNNISHATFDQGLSLECSESEFSSDHLSDGDEYVPSKAEIRSQEYLSSEVSCDENDDTLREKPTKRFSTEYQPETTYLDHAITEQTGCNVSDECLNESVANNTSTGQTSAGGSQPTSPWPFPIQDKQRQTRKRVRNEDDWKINARKRLRNRGQSYVSRTGKTHRNRVLKSGCGDLCRNKCKTQITEDERAQIFHNFWKMGCLTQLRQYLCNTVQKNEKKKKNYNNKTRFKKKFHIWILSANSRKECESLQEDVSWYSWYIWQICCHSTDQKEQSRNMWCRKKEESKARGPIQRTPRRKRSDDTSTAFLEWKVTMQERIQQESIWKVPSVCKKIYVR